MAVYKQRIESKRRLTMGSAVYDYYSLVAAAEALGATLGRLPFTIKILIENLLRFDNGSAQAATELYSLLHWQSTQEQPEIAWRPARVLMQDFTGVPAIVDLAAMREAVAAGGGDPAIVNPQIPVDLVIDHSVTVERAGDAQAFAVNVAQEMVRNHERYQFLHWGQGAFDNFRVVPPGTGICHQVNLEFLADVVHCQACGQETLIYPDTVVGTDSHTTMINALAVLGWGVGGIEAEAAMLGEAVSMRVPEVVGVVLHGELRFGVTATDLVLTLTELLRRKGVVGKFVEFCGPGLNQLSLADRATIANMAPEFGATCAFFAVDQQTLDYLQLSGRDPAHIALVQAYCKAQGLWRDPAAAIPEFSDTLVLELTAIEPCVAGPKRPQDRVLLAATAAVFERSLHDSQPAAQLNATVPVSGRSYALHHGDVVIAAITSCTNTSNPAVMLTAALLAKKAVARGMTIKPWVKASLAPGSKVVSEYLQRSGLQPFFDQLGFNLVGYGCTTCIGNSGPLAAEIADAIRHGDLNVCAVLSGNRNFEGRIHPLARSSWLASPPLVVAYALAGTVRIDLNNDPIAADAQGRPVYLHELWPDAQELRQAQRMVSAELFRQQYADVFNGNPQWQQLESVASSLYPWLDSSTYIRRPPFFTAGNSPQDIENARILALLGDSITTDHISPAGTIAADSPAARYLHEQGVAAADFNSYGARRGNHEVMMRGTFANTRLRNEMTAPQAGGVTRLWPSGEIMPIFDAAMAYQHQQLPLVVIAGKEYGTGSSRDWAAKGTLLLGVRAVIAESFERIHRSNLIGMGVLPLQFQAGQNRHVVELVGDEVLSVRGLGDTLSPGGTLVVQIRRQNGAVLEIVLRCRIDTEEELNAYRSGGILHYVLQHLLAQQR